MGTRWAPRSFLALSLGTIVVLVGALGFLGRKLLDQERDLGLTRLDTSGAESLRERVTSCEEANSYFKSMRNAAIREIVVKTSADLPQALRDILDKTAIGHLTAPEVTKQGVEMVALCGRKATTVDTPKKREVRDKMYVQKYEAKSKAYLAEVRKAAMIEYPGGK